MILAFHSIDNDFFLIEFNFKKLSSVKEKYLVNKYRLYIDLGKNVMVICILSKNKAKPKKRETQLSPKIKCPDVNSIIPLPKFSG